MTPSSYCASMILGMRHLDVNFKGNVESMFGSDVNLPVEDEEAGFDLRARACPDLEDFAQGSDGRAVLDSPKDFP